MEKKHFPVFNFESTVKWKTNESMVQLYGNRMELNVFIYVFH